MTDPTTRFSSRVENYRRHRPTYPPQVLDLLAAECGLTPESSVADVGSGTGLLTALLLQRAGQVFGVEPNAVMRSAAEQELATHPHFVSVAGRAEATTLPDASIDLITAGQAFHWFDRAAARAEFRRILRPGGWVALIWNIRRFSDDPFLHGYEQLLRDYCPEYTAQHDPQRTHEPISAFFPAGACQLGSFEQRQLCDLDGLRGRLLSSSYAPEPGHPSHAPMLDALARLFAANQCDGVVALIYDTQVYYGQLG